MNSTASSLLLLARLIIAPCTPMNALLGLPAIDGSGATPKSTLLFFRLSHAHGPVIIMAISPLLTPASIAEYVAPLGIAPESISLTSISAPWIAPLLLTPTSAALYVPSGARPNGYPPLAASNGNEKYGVL